MFTAPDYQVDIKVGEQRLTHNLSDMLRIDADNILNEVLEHSATLGYVTALKVQAEQDSRELKNLLNRLRAEMVQQFEDEKEAGKKITIAAMDAAIEVSPSYCEAKGHYEAAQGKVDELAGIVSALQARSQLLSVTANVIARSETPVFLPRETPKEAVATAKERDASKPPPRKK